MQLVDHILHPAGRAISGALGLWVWVNLPTGWRSPGFDPNVWWIDLPMPAAVSAALLAVFATLALAWAVRPWMSPLRRRATALITAGLAAVAVGNAAGVVKLIIDGRVSAAVPLPLSALVAVVLGGLALLMLTRPVPTRRPVGRLAWMVAVAGAMTVAMPLAQMVTFGYTDYRRPADAVVVLGCRAYADGRPSDALADRVATAARLYHAGHAPLLIMSGGPGDGAIDEPTAMKRFAVSLGVPADRIVLDPAGLNTAATVANAGSIFQRHGVRRALAVSHFYHLPRIKLACDSAQLTVYTVPAEQRYTLSALPYNMAREVAAWWVYYLRAVCESVRTSNESARRSASQGSSWRQRLTQS